MQAARAPIAAAVTGYGVEVFSLVHGASHHSFAIDADAANGAALGPTGSVVATVEPNTPARVWDVSSGRVLAVIRGPTAVDTRIQIFSVTNGELVPLRRERRLYACDVCGTTAQVEAAARHLLTRGLTHAERRTYLAGT